MATDGARPGSITFEDIHGSIVNVTNDPERMSDSSPAVVDIEARFGGSGDVSLEMRLPLLASPATMSYRGSVTNLDASALNSILPNLLGLRFTRGRVDSIAFNIDVARGRATGVVQGIYRDLSVQIIDKATHERSLGDRLKSFAANHLLLRTTNVPRDGKAPTVGRVDHRFDRNAAFFSIFWGGLRSGLLSLLRR